MAPKSKDELPSPKQPQRHRESTPKHMSDEFASFTTMLAVQAQFDLIRTANLWKQVISDLDRTFSYKGKRPIDILSLLAVFENGLAPSELSKYTFRSRQAISQIIKDMEQEGLVERQHLENNNKTIKVSLTEEGWAYIEEIMPKFRKLTSVTKIIYDDDEKLKELRDTLKQIRKKLYGIQLDTFK